MDKAYFCWHTKRGFAYPDAYWQWVKSSDYLIEEACKDDEHLINAYKNVYNCGWQYDMCIIKFDEFVVCLKEASLLIKESDCDPKPEYSAQWTSFR